MCGANGDLPEKVSSKLKELVQKVEWLVKS
jgi:hypothetical protein